MICDYFFPKVGGVESHIYSLAEALAQLDHKVRRVVLPRRSAAELKAYRWSL